MPIYGDVEPRGALIWRYGTTWCPYMEMWSHVVPLYGDMVPRGSGRLVGVVSVSVVDTGAIRARAGGELVALYRHQLGSLEILLR